MATDALSRLPVAAVLLAAGRSERMGAAKALLDWNGPPLVAHQVGVLAAAEAICEIVVITGHAARRVRRALADLGARVVHNQHYRQGRATSVVAGVRALTSQPAGILIVSVDQPLRPEILGQLLRAWGQTPDRIVRPIHKGSHGHPVLFPADLRADLAAVSDADQGLRAVLRRHATRLLDVDLPYPDVLLNLNTAEAYRQAHRRHLAGGD